MYAIWAGPVQRAQALTLTTEDHDMNWLLGRSPQGETKATAAQWAVSTAIMPDGHIGIESDTGWAKVGDGVKTWAQLEYTPYSLPGRETVLDLTGVIDFQYYRMEGNWYERSPLAKHNGGKLGRYTVITLERPVADQAKISIFDSETGNKLYDGSTIGGTGLYPLKLANAERGSCLAYIPVATTNGFYIYSLIAALNDSGEVVLGSVHPQNGGFGTSSLVSTNVRTCCMGLARNPQTDPITGDPIPTFAVGYGEGFRATSIIREDGSVFNCNSTRTAPAGGATIAITEGKLLYVWENGGARYLYQLDIDTAAADFNGEAIVSDATGGYALAGEAFNIAAFSGTKGALISNEGLVITEGMNYNASVSHTASSFGSGVVHRGYRGNWGAPGESTLDGFAHDKSGRGNSLTVNGSLISTATAPGSDVHALSGFSALNYMNRAGDADFAFGTESAMIAAWINTTVTGVPQIILNIRTGTGSYIIVNVTASNTLQGIFTDTFVSDYLASTKNVCDGAWHHVVFLRNGSETQLWIDGVLDGSIADSSIDVASNDLFVGVESDTTDPFGGSIAMLHASAVVLTPDQIKRMYHYEKRLIEGEPALFGGDYYGWMLEHTVGAWGIKGASSRDEWRINHATDADMVSVGVPAVNVLPNGFSYLSGFSTADYFHSNSAALRIGTSSATAAVWLTFSTNGSYQVAFGQHGNNVARWIIQMHPSNYMQVQIQGANLISKTVTFQVTSLTGWHHVAFTLDRSDGSFKVYIDGSFWSSQDASSLDSLTNTNYTTVGQNDLVNIPEGPQTWQGNVAAPRLSVGHAASPAEIKAMYDYEKRIIVDGEDLPLEGYINEVLSASIDEKTGYVHAARKNGVSIFDGPVRVGFQPRPVSKMSADGADKIILLDDYKIVKNGDEGGILTPNVNLRDSIKELELFEKSKFNPKILNIVHSQEWAQLQRFDCRASGVSVVEFDILNSHEFAAFKLQGLDIACDGSVIFQCSSDGTTWANSNRGITHYIYNLNGVGTNNMQVHGSVTSWTIAEAAPAYPTHFEATIDNALNARTSFLSRGYVTNGSDGSNTQVGWMDVAMHPAIYPSCRRIRLTAQAGTFDTGVISLFGKRW